MIRRTIEALKKNPEFERIKRSASARHFSSFEEAVQSVAKKDENFENAFLMDAHETVMRELQKELSGDTMTVLGDIDDVEKDDKKVLMLDKKQVETLKDAMMDAKGSLYEIITNDFTKVIDAISTLVDENGKVKGK